MAAGHIQVPVAPAKENVLRALRIRLLAEVDRLETRPVPAAAVAAGVHGIPAVVALTVRKAQNLVQAVGNAAHAL